MHEVYTNTSDTLHSSSDKMECTMGLLNLEQAVAFCETAMDTELGTFCPSCYFAIKSKVYSVNFPGN